MKDFLGDDLKHKDITSKSKDKDSYYHHIWDFAYFNRYGQWTLISEQPTMNIFVQAFFSYNFIVPG